MKCNGIDKMKILYVHHSNANGGATMSLFYLIQRVRSIHDVVVYFWDDGPAVDFYRENGITCYVNKQLTKYPHCTIEHQSLNPFSIKFYDDIRKYSKFLLNFVPSYFAMKKIIKLECPDVVHLNSSVLLSEGLAVKKMKVKLVWHLRDFIHYGNWGIRRRLISKIITHSSDEIVALCESEARRVAGNTSKINIIPNFVDLSKFNPDSVKAVNLRERYDWPEDTPIVAMLGWNFESNGIIPLVKAFGLVLNEIPDAKLVLFGKGVPNNAIGLSSVSMIKYRIKKLIRYRSLYEQISSIVTDNHMRSSVVFPGTFFDIANYINEVDIVTVPFVDPHFARPILEAGAMSKVVVTSDLDGTREMVCEGDAGYLAKPGDPQDIAHKIISALQSDNSILVERMYLNVKQNYNADVNSSKTISLY